MIENDLGQTRDATTKLEKLLLDIQKHKGTINVSGGALSAPTAVTEIHLGRGLTVTVSGGVAYVSSAYPAFAEAVFVATSGSGYDEHVDYNNREYYVKPYTKFRIIVHQTNTNGNTYTFQYHSGSAWTNAGSAVTTAGVVVDAVTDLSYHQGWQDIPSAMITSGMVFIRVKLDHADAATDTSLCVVQFWDGQALAPSTSAVTPTASPTALPTVS
jgi:hypothetical protein